MFKHQNDVHKKYSDHNRAHCFLLMAIMLLVACIVAGISYGAYLFIDATHISNSAGVHLTKNISLTVDAIKGNLYTDESRGIKDWIVYTDNLNGFQIKYPNDLKLQKNDENILSLKKYLNNNSKSSSLSFSVNIGTLSLQSEDILREAAKLKGITLCIDPKEELFAGRMGVRTEKVKTEDGLVRDAIFWKDDQENKVFYLEATYFTDKTISCENIFENIISEFKFI
ncbi:MAG: hypothetical protein UR99_C0031G0005 [Candidatus Moranbacteria bacterium GW2011_GWD2_36_12]|nr:MAG: hypothetical protein UR99_C0031G0005 [Candidatus Moranbacteria bacterium GW2011_GWD2_36_12]KKQ06721.1 MAG: hypothetical protein US16_C0010G0005 [Candidatus Moranbacteria bacterium GW2011_GWE2_36_40]